MVVWNVLAFALLLGTLSCPKRIRQLVNSKYPLGIELVDFGGAYSPQLAQMVDTLGVGRATVVVNADITMRV